MLQIEAQLNDEQLRSAVILYLREQGWKPAMSIQDLREHVRIDSWYPSKESGIEGVCYEAKVFVVPAVKT